MMKGQLTRAAVLLALACVLGLAVATPLDLEDETLSASRQLSACGQRFVEMSDEDLFDYTVTQGNMIGSCTIEDARSQGRRECDFYAYQEFRPGSVTRPYPSLISGGPWYVRMAGCVPAPDFPKGYSVCPYRGNNYDITFAQANAVCTDSGVHNAAEMMRQMINRGLCGPINECPEPCENAGTQAQCNNILSRNSCNLQWVRLRCRRSCNACNTFELPSPPNFSKASILYGNNHVLTWDRLPFDCNGKGEHVLAQNARTGLQINALFDRPNGVRSSVTRGVVVRGETGADTMQMSINMPASAGASSSDDCVLSWFIGNAPITQAQVNQPGGWRGFINRESFRQNFYNIDLRSGARVQVDVRYGREQGCYMEWIALRLPEDLVADTTGLMGTPDNNMYNDWVSRTGRTFNVPGRAGRAFKSAYDYSSRNWCVRNSSFGLFNYSQMGGNFGSFQKCLDPYDGVFNFSTATQEMRRVCGQNFECLTDAFYTGLATEGVNTNSLITEVEIGSNVFGLRVEPRKVRNGVSRVVKITVHPETIPANLEGYNIYEISPLSLRRTGEALFVARDGGESNIGDDDANDNVFSFLHPVTLNGGLAAGFEAVPIINGSEDLSNPQQIFTLPNAVRSYSVASGVAVPTEDDQSFTLPQGRIGQIFLEARYIWPEDQNDLDTGTRFLGESVGYACPAPSSDRYLLWSSGDDVTTGGLETARIEIGRAFLDGRFSAITDVFFHTHWFIGDSGTGPIVLSVVAKWRGSGIALPNTQLQLALNPVRDDGCAGTLDTSLAATMSINRNTNNRYIFRLSKEN